MSGNLSIEGRARMDILNAALSAGPTGAHIAPSLSLVEISLAVLGSRKDGDSVILSKGHGALGYYAAMHQLGVMSDDEFQSFEKDGGLFPGQPCRNDNDKIEYSGGSLGMGLSYGVGVATAKKQKGRVFVILGDGELNEGSNWESAQLASRLALSNLVAIVDSNGLQSDGVCMEIIGVDYRKVWSAFGWDVVECDGHSVEGLKRAIGEVRERPTVIFANTVKGKGVSFMEQNNEWHHHVLNEETFSKAAEEVNAHYGE